MEKKDLIEGKKILIVDDEPDVLETLEELLESYEVVPASSFDQAKTLLESEHFDIAILDIMGVNGYELLKIAGKRKVIAVMLTAHALTIEDTEKSFREGASYYVPKDKMIEIVTYLNDILEAAAKGKSPFSRWSERFNSYYKKRFGTSMVNYEEFWKEALKDKKL